jgi:hypothetical protein
MREVAMGKNRKVIQIINNSTPTKEATFLTVLCDDGTMWQETDGTQNPNLMEVLWVRITDIPQHIIDLEDNQ